MNVAVRTLCAFTAKTGDLDVRFTPAPTALEGQEGHAAVAARRGAGYQREISLSGQHGELRVRGRTGGAVCGLRGRHFSGAHDDGRVGREAVRPRHEWPGQRRLRLGVQPTPQGVAGIARIALHIELRRQQFATAEPDLDMDVRRATGVGRRLERAETEAAVPASVTWPKPWKAASARSPSPGWW